ncbi:hypothetical protein G6F57_012160 [Rhizopus arrhizus]|uniref:Profilin n=1 Tax=Rhizopus oryzae TaxID=64495 RepID=A0A9P6X6U5_RHIOR|nr:hypothetical protein G6F30_008824 [Rhizopus arrhizus]KAG1391990.1 hypothetical protein G6F58_012603 [Rhizopus delemar]KAG0974896.1 hypothetical protein G6F29_011909 [Rhizopus arrhizus]KAG0979875.1 hypothetical protein G6F28_011790 [Rhizopus arrhizus]KAG1002494.1 hypothetical protein G6F27_011912 [Rhizopus arrhizus]
MGSQEQSEEPKDIQSQEEGNVSQAAICGQAGGIWAASAGFQPSPFEIRSIADAFANPNIAAANGILVEGNKYIMINAEGRFIYGRNVKDCN